MGKVLPLMIGLDTVNITLRVAGFKVEGTSIFVKIKTCVRAW